MKLLKCIIVPFALAFVGVVRLIAPWKLVRFGESFDFRLGHMIGNTECYLCEKDAGMHPDSYDIWIPRSPGIANICIGRKYRKLLHTMPGWFGCVVMSVNRLFNGWEKHCVAPSNWDRDIHNLWGKPHIGFTEQEEKKGQKLLRSLGIPLGAKWVCVFVRDSAYMQQTFGGGYSYHDFRDSDIADCVPAAFALMRRGYYVIRMGKIVDKPFQIKSGMIIDYSLRKNQTDFGQFYLGAKCAFAVGSHSGFMSIPQVFNRPIALINYVPVEYMPTFANGILIWKHHIKDGKRMTFRQITETLAGHFMMGHFFEKIGITLQDNTADEITQLAMEMADIFEGSIPSDQSEFWDAFPRSRAMPSGVPLHGKITLRIGSEFLKGYQ